MAWNELLDGTAWTMASLPKIPPFDRGEMGFWSNSFHGRRNPMKGFLKKVGLPNPSFIFLLTNIISRYLQSIILRTMALPTMTESSNMDEIIEHSIALLRNEKWYVERIASTRHGLDSPTYIESDDSQTLLILFFYHIFLL